MFIIITSSHWLTHGQQKYWYGITQHQEKFSLFYWACREPPAGKCRMLDGHKTSTFHSLSHSRHHKTWCQQLGDSEEMISNKIVMKPSHCMKWLQNNFTIMHVFMTSEWQSGTSYDLSISECGKYRQISAINPCLFSPRERGMHPVIYASVEITEKAREKNVAFYWMFPLLWPWLLVSLADSYLLM